MDSDYENVLTSSGWLGCVAEDFIFENTWVWYLLVCNYWHWHWLMVSDIFSSSFLMMFMQLLHFFTFCFSFILLSQDRSLQPPKAWHHATHTHTHTQTHHSWLWVCHINKRVLFILHLTQELRALTRDLKVLSSSFLWTSLTHFYLKPWNTLKCLIGPLKYRNFTRTCTTSP